MHGDNCISDGQMDTENKGRNGLVRISGQDLGTLGPISSIPTDLLGVKPYN